MRYLIIIILFLSGCFLTHGQQLFTQNYPIEVYQGASQNWSIRQNKNGVICVANTDGVLLYNGYQWDMISLPSKKIISCLDTDSTGKIYICSEHELGYFQKGLTGKYEYVSLLAKIPDSCKYDASTYLVRFFDNKAFFMGNDHVYIYTNNRFKILRTNCEGFIRSKKNLYAQKDDALYRYKNEDFETTPYFRKIEGMKYDWITDYSPSSFLILDDKNKVWLIDEKQPDRYSIFSEELNRNLKNLKIHSMTCLDNGNIAVQVNDGILFFNKEGKLCNRIFQNDLAKWGSIFEDKQHNLWANADSDILQIMSYHLAEKTTTSM
jgi:ligand-binding sensor domain-containing protein